jgi:hypothetical protein
MGEVAYEEYLELVGARIPEALGSGESAALALANEVQGIVVLDDRKARRIARLKYPGCTQWSSARLFKEAFAIGAVPNNVVIEGTRNAMTRARMHISAEDRDWIAELGL